MRSIRARSSLVTDRGGGFLVTLSTVAAFAVACSSSDRGNNSGPQGQGGFGNTANGGYGNFGAFGGQGQGGNGIPPAPATCNNGQVDPGEDCDGPVNQTCESATLGASPNGTVACTNCHIDTSGCSSSNPGSGGAGTGGGVGTGGGINNGGSGGTDNPPAGNTPPPDKLPPTPANCPNLTTGAQTINGTATQLWVGSKPGPMYFYWHATGQDYTEVTRGMPGVTTGVATDGGIVASFATTNSQGTNTGNGVWFTGDLDSADQILACGIKAGLVDTSRIYTAGYSAGGLQACAMVSLRGKYLAAAICYSGGAAIISGTPQDKSYLPPTLLAHGGAGKDTFILDFAQASATWESQYKAAGGFSIDCDDGGDHITSAYTRQGLGGHAMEFFRAHPYNAKPEPYAGGLPGGWPSYCKIY